MVTVALVTVGSVGGLNLLLTAALIRRLREHARMLRNLTAPWDGELTLPVGSPVEDVSFETVAGVPTSLHQLAEGGLALAFFAADCPSCKPQIPQFREHVTARNGKHGLAVVTGDGPSADALVDSLGPDMSVVVESQAGPLAAAFGVAGYPTFVSLGSDHRIVASGMSIDDVRELS